MKDKASFLLGAWITQTRAPDALRGPFAAADVFEHLRRITRGEPRDYELRDVTVKAVIPSQSGDDYLNDSSRYTAEKIRMATTIEDLPRQEDVLPILLDDGSRIVDGNHRHAAAILNNDEHLPALVPVRTGTGRILNIAELA